MSDKPCVLCFTSHESWLIRELCRVGFYATAMDVAAGRLDGDGAAFRLRRDASGRSNPRECRSLADRLADQRKGER